VLKLKLKRYDGAGVLNWVKNPTGEKEILLCLRKYGFDKNTWSIPGGGLELQDAGDLIRCALREASEEGFGGLTAVERALTAAHTRELKQPGSSSVRIRLPFFNWRTLLVELPEKPKGWPKNIREFHEARWFALSKLPPRTHWGVRWVVKFLR
jgi:8-oxo-dGTP pyrophosphatase MutT (NUDIX family)